MLLTEDGVIELEQWWGGGGEGVDGYLGGGLS